MSSVADIRVVEMEEGDLPEVLAIEHEGHPAPWSEAIFREELERTWARLVVVRKGHGRGVIVGFANFWVVSDEIQILNIVTTTSERRQGHGLRLMNYILNMAKQQKSRLVTLEVRTGNKAAIALYGRFGFVAVGVRPNYYADNKEDALVMNLEV